MILEMKKKKIIFMPVEIVKSSFAGSIYGTYFEDSGVYNIIEFGAKNLKTKFEYLGEIAAEKKDLKDGLLFGHLDGQKITFFLNNQELSDYKIEIYEKELNLFSRNAGILENSWMKENKAIVIGCGSGGSLTAVELAKAGVGNFFLVDFDILEYHNISRHQCGISDVGDFKVNALRRKIHDINPNANVEVFKGAFDKMGMDKIDKVITNKSILIGCSDDRSIYSLVNFYAMEKNVPFVLGGLWKRAFAGEIFVFIPDDKSMICYSCANSTEVEMDSHRVEMRRYYTSEEDLEKANFEPGLSVDINYLVIIKVKLLIDILNRKNPKYTIRLLDKIHQTVMVCNNLNAESESGITSLFEEPLQVKANFVYEDSCRQCDRCKALV